MKEINQPGTAFVDQAGRQHGRAGRSFPRKTLAEVQVQQHLIGLEIRFFQVRHHAAPECQGLHLGGAVGLLAGRPDGLLPVR